MSIARSLLVALTLVPAGQLTAQRARPPVVVRVPDLGWIGPVVAEAQARAAAALDRVAPSMAQVGPALVQARAGMMKAQAALAGTDIRLQGLEGLQGLQGFRGLRMSGSFGFERDDFDTTPPAPWAQQDPADGIYSDARAALNRGRYTEAARRRLRQVSQVHLRGRCLLLPGVCASPPRRAGISQEGTGRAGGAEARGSQCQHPARRRPARHPDPRRPGAGRGCRVGRRYRRDCRPGGGPTDTSHAARRNHAS